MTEYEIHRLTEDVSEALNNTRDLIRERDFYLRVLKQAVLTNNGELVIDIFLADKAKNETRKLEFYDGGVRFMN